MTGRGRYPVGTWRRVDHAVDTGSRAPFLVGDRDRHDVDALKFREGVRCRHRERVGARDGARGVGQAIAPVDRDGVERRIVARVSSMKMATVSEKAAPPVTATLPANAAVPPIVGEPQMHSVVSSSPRLAARSSDDEWSSRLVRSLFSADVLALRGVDSNLPCPR